MNEGDERPRATRLVMIVDNEVTVDSRVQKCAFAARDAGFEVIVVGRAPGRQHDEIEIEGVKVYRRFVSQKIRNRNVSQPRFKLSTPFAYRSQADLQYWQMRVRLNDEDAALRIRVLKDKSSGGGLSGGARQVAAKAQGGKARVRREWYKLRRRQFEARQELEQLKRTNKDIGAVNSAAIRAKYRVAPKTSWRLDDPWLLDWQAEVTPFVAGLKPQLIHSHDARALAIGVRATRRIEKKHGYRPALLADVHEWVGGAGWAPQYIRESLLALQDEYIPYADYIITVSDELARMLVDAYDLDDVPDVVLNAPITAGASSGAGTIRDRLVLPPGTPLMVYSGAMAKQRGVETVLQALTLMPDVHLAIVVGGFTGYVRDFLGMARELGVSDRVHTTGYVPPSEVSNFLSTADIGLIPLHREPNHEIALITKYQEYALASLPIVVSDVRTMSEFTRTYGNGEVFVAEDVESFVGAVRKVLAKRGDYVDAYARHADVFGQLTWEVQSDKLVEIYRQISDGVPAPEEAVDALAAARAAEKEGSQAAKRTAVDAAVEEPGTREPSLLITPANMAGQAYAWSRCLTQREGISAANWVIERTTGFGFPADRFVVPPAGLAVPASVLEEVAAERTHVLLECAMNVLGQRSAADSVWDTAKKLRARGVEVGFILHGSEIRDPDLHARIEHPSVFTEGMDPEYREALTNRVTSVRETIEFAGGRIFISTPDLFDFAPASSTWLPLVVDVPSFRGSQPCLEGGRPVVLHAPSRRALKGSDAIDGQLRALDEEGLIEYRPLHGVPHDEMPEAIAAADIVVDQIGIGGYGVLAVEAMSAQRLVLSHAGRRTRARLGVDLPIVEVGFDDLTAVVRDVLANRDHYRAIATSGLDFAETHHDGRMSAHILAEWLRA